MSIDTDQTQQPTEQPTGQPTGQPTEVRSDTATPMADPHPDHVEIRRNTGLNVVLGIGGAALAIGYLQRASSGGSVLDWLLCVVMAVIGLVNLLAVIDARTPLLVADDQGVRIRLNHEWLGLPWNTLEQVVIERREGPVRDGRLVLVPRNIGNALESLLRSSRRTVAWQRRLHGDPLTVPLSIATRSTSRNLDADLRVFAAERSEVVVLRGRERARLHEPPPRRSQAPAEVAVEQVAATAPVAPTSPERVEAAAVAEPEQARLIAPVAAIRAARSVTRAEIFRAHQPRPVPAAPDEPERPERVAAAPLRSSGAVVFEDQSPDPVAEPVIGPELVAARQRAGLSIDELSERTRIRPHVLEAMEVDDFTPCGGDFYARGHLATLARYLGLDLTDLLSAYDANYSHAPINARRVFEAELATGMSGGIRATIGGPRWGLLVGAVLALLMLWGVARFFTDQPAQIASMSPLVSDSAGLAANRVPITSPLTHTRTLTVLAIGGHSAVSIRDRNNHLLWSGVLHGGQRHQVAGVAPFTVHAADATVVRVQLGKTSLGQVGPATGPGQRRVG